MILEALIDYCLTKVGAFHDYKSEWQADRVQVANKMFALLGVLRNRPSISLKSDIIRAELLKDKYTDIIPGYHLNKAHWITIYIDGNVPDKLIFDCIDKSYGLVIGGLPKKTQKMLQGY